MTTTPASTSSRRSRCCSRCSPTSVSANAGSCSCGSSKAGRSRRSATTSASARCRSPGYCARFSTICARSSTRCPPRPDHQTSPEPTRSRSADENSSGGDQACLPPAYVDLLSGPCRRQCLRCGGTGRLADHLVLHLHPHRRERDVRGARTDRQLADVLGAHGNRVVLRDGPGGEGRAHEHAAEAIEHPAVIEVGIAETA